VSGHDLVREIIAKHGVDRYPDTQLILLKLMEEIGELARAYLRESPVGEDFRKEYADVGLTLYALGNWLGLDLIEEMQRVVDNETRRFM
jgi:NTP pyrophosphatase (non-canonical NTP hydrolase)